MYDRAMLRLKSLLKSRGLKESAIKKNNFDLYHFHIDAFDNRIQLNKFETKAGLDNDESLINRSINSSILKDHKSSEAKVPNEFEFPTQ